MKRTSLTIAAVLAILSCGLSERTEAHDDPALHSSNVIEAADAQIREDHASLGRYLEGLRRGLPSVRSPAALTGATTIGDAMKSYGYRWHEPEDIRHPKFLGLAYRLNPSSHNAIINLDVRVFGLTLVERRFDAFKDALLAHDGSKARKEALGLRKQAKLGEIFAGCFVLHGPAAAIRCPDDTRALARTIRAVK